MDSSKCSAKQSSKTKHIAPIGFVDLVSKLAREYDKYSNLCPSVFGENLNSNALKTKFLIQLAKSLHKSGTSTHELERDLMEVSGQIGVEGSFLITPTSVSMTLDFPEESQSVNLRLFPGTIDLRKLNQTRFILDQVLDGDLTIESALDALETIDGEKQLYPLWARIISFGLVGACLTMFLGGNGYDFFTALFAGLLVGGAVFAMRGARVEPVRDALIAFGVTCLAFLVKTKIGEISVNTVVISSLIILIPGLSLTISISELANKHVSSGTARLMGATVDFFKLGAGIIAGHHLASFFSLPVLSAPARIYSLVEIAFAVIVCSVSTAVVFNSEKRDVPWIGLGSILAIGSLGLLEKHLATNTSIFVASLAVGIFCNLFSQYKRRSPTTLLLPSIVFLVPGSIGLKGLNLLLSNNLALGAEQGLKTITTAVLIVSGLFFADAIWPTGRTRAVDAAKADL